MAQWKLPKSAISAAPGGGAVIQLGHTRETASAAIIDTGDALAMEQRESRLALVQAQLALIGAVFVVLLILEVTGVIIIFNH